MWNCFQNKQKNCNLWNIGDLSHHYVQIKNTKILANLVKQILPDVISQEKSCTVPRRAIFNNLFLTKDLVKYTKEK